MYQGINSIKLISIKDVSSLDEKSNLTPPRDSRRQNGAGNTRFFYQTLVTTYVITDKINVYIN